MTFFNYINIRVMLKELIPLLYSYIILRPLIKDKTFYFKK